MDERLRNKRGITLVALVVTIIILLILAGVAIAGLSGEDGLLVKTKLAKEKYAISEAKEKLEFAITGLRIEQEGKGENLTKEDLPKLNNDEIDVGSVENFPVGVIYGKYKFNIDENFIVTYVGEADGTIITYTTEPEGYTNKDEIQILIKIVNPKGIKTIEYPDGDKLEVSGATERGIDYKVISNGIYTFKIISQDDKEIIKDVVIDQIDKLEPIDFTPEITKNGSDIIITSNAQDAESDGISTKSGIDYCEYYLKDSNNKTTKYDTNEINNLALGTYQIYVIAYDRAGNSKQSSTVEIKISIQFDKISAGKYHSFAIDKQGNLWGFGLNNTTILENNSYLDTCKPIKIHEGIKFKDIKTSEQNTLAIDIEGNLYSWGINTYGAIGNGETENEICGLTQIMQGTKFKEISVADFISRVIDENGRLWSFGYMYLGNGTRNMSGIPIKIQDETKFKKIEVGGNYNNGWNFNIAIDENGRLWSWGYNFNKYTLGYETSNDFSMIPLQIDTGNIKFKEISAGEGYCTIAIDEEGNLWSWGYNQNGQLGDGTTNSNASVTKIDTGDVKFKKVSARVSHSLAIDEEGNIWSWGYNNYGQLGDGTIKSNASVTKIDTGDVRFKEISAGYYHSLALDENGNLWSWGNNQHGQLGTGTKQYYIAIPFQI